MLFIFNYIKITLFTYSLFSGYTHEGYLAWDDPRAHEVQLKILNNINTLHRFTDDINSNTYTIDQSVQTFTTFIRDHAFNVFGKTRGRAKGLKKRNLKNTSKWFNSECYVARKEYNKSRNSFIPNKSTQNKLDFFEKKRIYNRITRTHKTQFKKQEGVRTPVSRNQNLNYFGKKLNHSTNNHLKNHKR